MSWPGLVAVEEAERLANELRVERVSDVELDAERLPAGDQPPPQHECRLHKADCQDERDDQPEAVERAVRQRAIDGRADEERDGDRRQLRADREQRRDDERPLVRPQEPEQAAEGRAMARYFGHLRNLVVGPLVRLRPCRRRPAMRSRATSRSPTRSSARASTTSSSSRATSRTSSWPGSGSSGLGCTKASPPWDDSSSSTSAAPVSPIARPGSRSSRHEWTTCGRSWTR